MDRKLQADSQWFVSPLLNLQICREDLIAARQSGEDSIYWNIDDTEVKSEKDKEKAIWLESMCMVEGVTDEEAAEVVEEVSNLEMFMDVPTDTSTRTLDDMKGKKEDLKTSSLFTHRTALKRDEFVGVSRQRKSAYATSLKYDKFMLLGSESSSMYRPQCLTSAKCEDDILIVVDVLTPYNRILQSAELRSSRLLKPVAKLLLRGETFLRDLRQKLSCPSDTVVPLENGSELDPLNFDNSTAVRFPSSFIFIHDTFYVDDSNPSAIDISLPIRNFMLSKDCFDPVDAKKMSDVKIVDLSLRLGQPYVFQHSGNCEHLLVFHDLRLMHQTDPQEIQNYPFILYEKGNEKKCDICKKNYVEFVVERHELLPSTYTYFCRNCFQEFNFVHGVKTHAFHAWPYTECTNRDRRGWPFDEESQE